MRKVLALLLALFLTGCGSEPDTPGSATAPEAAVRARSGQLTVPLKPGWNGVGFQGAQVADLQSGAVGLAWFDGTGYQTGPVSASFINEGEGGRRGFWAFAPSAGNLTYVAETEATHVRLRAGWNLVSFARLTPLAGSELKAFQNGTEVALSSLVLPQFYELADGGYVPVDVTSGSLKPGSAYWVYGGADSELRWINPQPSPSPAASASPATEASPSPSGGGGGGGGGVVTPTPTPSPSPVSFRHIQMAVDLKSVAYGNGRYVADGVGGRFTATDGLTWTLQSGAEHDTLAVCFDGLQFVSVGDEGTVQTSPDGVTWTTRTSNTSDTLAGVTAGTGSLVAVGLSGRVIRSTDAGVTWTVENSGASDFMNDVKFAGGQFVAVGQNGRILTSPDGVTWTSRSASGPGLRSVAWRNGIYVAVGDGGTILRSTDGWSWTAQSSGTSVVLNAVAADAGQFLALGAEGTVLTSADGSTWTSVGSGQSRDLYEAVFTGSQWVVVGTSGTILTSSTGATWTARNTPLTTQTLSSVAAGGGRFVAVGGGGTILTSADGSTWVSANSGTGNGLARVAYGNGRFVAVGSGGTVLYSTDGGSTWLNGTLGTNDLLRGIATDGTRFVAVGVGGVIFTSTDGETWTQVTSPTTSTLLGVAYGNGRWVAFRSGQALTSENGVDWALGASVSGASRISFANGLFFVGGAGNVLYTSPDGLTWTSRDSANAAATWIAFGDRLYVMAASGGQCRVSEDGSTWTPLAVNMGGTRSLEGVAWMNNVFVLVGDKGAILASPASPAPAASPSPAAGLFERVNVGATGLQSNASTTIRVATSNDGRYVVYVTDATNLISGDTNNAPDVYLRDRTAATTTRVSLSNAGLEGLAGVNTDRLAMSSDGRYVAFSSESSNLVSGDTNGTSDIFLRDLQIGTTTRLSVDVNGVEGNGYSQTPSLSADGRYAAFRSAANNLVAADTNAAFDWFVKDIQTGTVTRVSVSSAGVEADGGQADGSISADGTCVVFASDATNLVAGDTNNARDVFKHVLATSTTTRVNTAADGSQSADGSVSDETGVSADGRYAVFRSSSALVPEDTNGFLDVYRKDTTTGTIVRISVSTAGVQGDQTGAGPFISADGNLVGFESDATNMVTDDTNGLRDVFLRNVTAGTTVILSRNGAQANGASLTDAGQGMAGATFTGDGLGVFFRSNASNLVTGDTNGFVDLFFLLVP